MKILYYFKFKNTPMFQWQKFHIFDELAASGVSIELFNPLDYESFDESNEKLLHRLKEGNIDLFMTTSNEHDLYLESLDYVHQMGIPSLLICFDNLTVPFAHKVISPHFDLVWLTSIETKYLFDKWGANSIFLPYASNPNITSIDFSTDIERVLFVGTPYGSRCKMINTLLEANIPVSLHARTTDTAQNFMPHNENGKGQLLKEISRMLSFPIGRKLALASIKNKFIKQSTLRKESACLSQYPPVAVDEMMKLYNSHALSLSSVSNRHTGVLKTPVFIVNLRSFEIPSAGGLQFCLFNPELNSYFEDGKEAVYYLNDDDMIDKAKFYLAPSNKKVREMIKHNARIKAINEHTWTNRFNVIFNNLGLK